jgi:hypothetical protein
VREGRAEALKGIDMPRRPKPIDSTLHGATDYSVGAFLVTAFPRLAGIQGTRAGRQIRTAGAVHAGYSTVTDYPLGIVKALPYKAHLAIDALGALALGATPFVTGEFRHGRRHWLPHVGLALFELGSLALTDPTGKGDYHGDVEAVRRANTEDPHKKIHEGPPAVRPRAAARAEAT